MPRGKPFKASVAGICAVAGPALWVTLDRSGKKTTRTQFTRAKLKQALRQVMRGDLDRQIAWLEQRKIIEPSSRGTFMITDKGERVVNRACSAWGR